MKSTICKSCGRDLPTIKYLRGKLCIWCDAGYYKQKKKKALKKKITYYGIGRSVGENIK